MRTSHHRPVSCSLWVAAACLVALAGPVSTASAGLQLNVTNSAGATVMAIPTSSNGQWSISGIRLYANVTTGTDPNLNAVNKVFYSVYSTSASTSTPAAGLTRVAINQPFPQGSTWLTKPVWQMVDDGEGNFIPTLAPYTYTGQPTGLATQSPTSQDLDGDGDLDRGSTGPLAYNDPSVPPYPTPPMTGYWGGIDADQINYEPLDSDGNPTGQPSMLLTYWSSSSNQRFATVSITHNAFSAQPYGHGITQIYMVGKVGESDWQENGVEIWTGTPVTGGKLTLYQTATAANTSGEELTIDQTTTSGLLRGGTSTGTMDHWTWKVRAHDTTDEFVTLYDSASDTYAMTWAYLNSLGMGSGDYDLELVTTWTDPLGQVTLPNANASTDSTNYTLLHTPEPGTLALLVLGGAAMLRRRSGRNVRCPES